MPVGQKAGIEELDLKTAVRRGDQRFLPTLTHCQGEF